MTDRDDSSPDLTRRRLLTRISLAGLTAYTAPALTHLGMAHASGGGDGGGDGGGSGGGGSGGAGSGGGSGSSGASGIGSGSAYSQGGSGGRGAAGSPNQPQRTVRRGPPPPPEIVIFVPDGVDISRAGAQGYVVRGRRATRVLGGTLYRIDLPQGRSVDQGKSELSNILPGARIDQNHIYTPDEFLCDGEGCGAHEMIGWSGWPSIYAPRIGMIDTGINKDHPALEGQKLTVHQADLAGRPASGRQHGTAIASMLIGRLDYRVPGLLPNAELIAVEAFYRGYYGDQADVFSLASAMDILLESGVNVINMSFSGPRNDVLEQIIQRAVDQNVAVVAAAGNGGPGAEPAYPAAFEPVLAVTAIDSDERAYRQANQGPYINFAAPGVRLWVAASISGGRLKSGTSYAAPFVTASLAVQRLRAPTLPLQQTVAAMENCAKDLGEAGRDPVFGHGLVAAPGQCFANDAEFLPASSE
ncbi:S8 family serine peptidase [Lutimaribacter saemankumensis]|uniref:Subtilase family protein n=1 Tax=Lutimaribacter saemankumensis TaxID=490829 RepID=A0A1G8Q8W9_9RHOB|nr:S8 family serine peptidase [Lutimaribacter saemankumensis]SDJ00996.1 Subtilase family protein [Lutimaribacter saemankumensis]